MSEAPSARPPAPERSVLVVDDSAFFRGLLSNLLAAEGIPVRAAEGGEEGWRLVQAHRPQVVLTDWMMPAPDGLELCRLIRAAPPLRRTYVILLTTRDRVEDAVAALEEGADDFITKSADPREVVVRVKAGLRVAALYEALAEAERRLAVGGMATALGHEIGNPLQIVTGLAELLARDDSLPEAAREKLATLLAAARRIDLLVKRVQALEQPRYTRYVGQSQMIDLGESASAPELPPGP